MHSCLSMSLTFLLVCAVAESLMSFWGGPLVLMLYTFSGRRESQSQETLANFFLVLNLCRIYVQATKQKKQQQHWNIAASSTAHWWCCNLNMTMPLPWNAQAMTTLNNAPKGSLSLLKTRTQTTWKDIKKFLHTKMRATILCWTVENFVFNQEMFCVKNYGRNKMPKIACWKQKKTCDDATSCKQETTRRRMFFTWPWEITWCELKWMKWMNEWMKWIIEMNCLKWTTCAQMSCKNELLKNEQKN